MYAVLRASVKLKKGVKLKKQWPDQGMCAAKVVRVSRAQSDIHPDTERNVYKVRYMVDGAEEDLEEEEELRRLLIVKHLPVSARWPPSAPLPGLRRGTITDLRPMFTPLFVSIRATKRPSMPLSQPSNTSRTV